MLDSLRKITLWITMLVVLFVQCSSFVHGIPRSDLKDLNRGTPAFKSSGVDDCNASSDEGSQNTNDSGNSGQVSQTKAEFLKKYAEAAYRNSLKTGVPYEFTLAQAILEGALTSQLALKYNNLFGIKADSSWHGKTVSLWTTEEVNGKDIRVMALWRVYDNPEDSFADHDKFLRENPRYAKAFQYSNDPFKFLVEVKAAGYATASDYVEKVSAVIREVIKWIAENTNLPPSSGITYEVPPPGGGSDDSDTTSAQSTSCAATDLTTPDEPSDPGDDSSTPTGTAQQLAQQLLNNPNVLYTYKDSKGLTVKEVLQHIVKTGKGIVNSPDVSFTEVAVSTKLLQALVDYAKTNKIGLNALTNADHSQNSNHYKGIAIDLACVPNLDRAAFDAIASKYGGKNNGETCPGARHWHYDFN